MYQSLLSMEEGPAKDEEEEGTVFLSYTHAWLDLRGSFTVHDNVYSFFLELCMQPMIRSRLDVGDSNQVSKSELVQTIQTDKDVSFTLICLDIMVVYF